jgi:Transglutaminase-like superfamily
MSTLRRLRAFLRLSRGERRLLAQGWAALLLAWLGLRLLPFQELLPWAAQVHQQAPRPGSDATWATIDGVERAVRRAAVHHLVPVRCLVRALATQWLLGQRGIKTELRIGVRKEAGVLQLHAWLEVEGRPIGEAEAVEERFARLVARDGVIEVAAHAGRSGL